VSASRSVVAPPVAAVAATHAPPVSVNRHYGRIPGQEQSPRPRIAVLRCCRPAQFAAATGMVRRNWPDAEVVAVSHPGHRPSLTAAGADAVHEVPGSRFGVFRLAPWRLWRLRAQRFDRVVIPQMTEALDAHVNLYWLAAALASPQVTILPGAATPLTLDRRDLLLWLPWLSCRRLLDALDVPLLLMLLAAARIVPRRPAAHGERRRVMHVIPTLGLGGAQRQLAAVVESTPPGAYDVEIVVFTADEGEFARAWLSRADVSVTVLRQWPRFSATTLEIARLCRERQVDVVHTWLCLANAIGGAGARLAGVPRVVSGVRSLSLWKRTWYRRWWYRPVDVAAARLADVVTVNARAVADDYARWTGISRRRITVVHNGLDPGGLRADHVASRRRLLAALGLDEAACLIGTVGRLAPEKGHEVLLHALAELRSSGVAVHGVVVGSGPTRESLRSLTSTLGLEGTVHFLGERHDVPELVAGLDLFVLPSIIEGFPNALLEAVMLGVPACATDVGGCPDVLDDDPAVLFAVNDVAGAVRVVRAALADRAASTHRAARMRTRALGLFTAARTSATWQRLYRGPKRKDCRDEA
jgi:glycosyltransferase involved in cell wall biosynthesis